MSADQNIAPGLAQKSPAVPGSLIALCSARGAPGVTTTAVGLALSWPRRVLLIEADMSASSAMLTGYFAGGTGADRNIVNLAFANREGHLNPEALFDNSIELPGNENARLIPGLVNPAQAPSMAEVWWPLTEAIARLGAVTGTDVIVDAGRCGTAYGPVPLLMAADVVALVTGTSLNAAAATRSRAQALSKDIDDHGQAGESAALLVVGADQPYSAKELQRVCGLPVAASIAHDPELAAVLSDGTPAPKRWANSDYARDLAQTARQLSQRAITTRTRLTQGVSA